jgi:nucleoside 2-deoxyribosyltransferase
MRKTNKNMKIYISGRISGQPNLNRGAFNDAAAAIINEGHQPINPHDICAGITAENEREHWRKCMRRCLAELVNCDIMVTLDGWEKSEGATLEVRIAQIIGMRVIPLSAIKLINAQTFEPVFGC